MSELTNEEVSVDVDLGRDREQNRERGRERDYEQAGSSGPGAGQGPNDGPDDLRDTGVEFGRAIAFAYLVGTFRFLPITVGLSAWYTVVRAPAVTDVYPRVADLGLEMAFASGHGLAWAFHTHPWPAFLVLVLSGGLGYIMLGLLGFWFGADAE